MAEASNPVISTSIMVEEEAVDDPVVSLPLAANVPFLKNAFREIAELDPNPANVGVALPLASNTPFLKHAFRGIGGLDPNPANVSSTGIEVQHITPDEKSLSSISVNIGCPQGCPRTFANSSALRIHLKQVHHKSHEDSFVLKPGFNIWYHCPIMSCLYHEKFRENGKHFPKLKYLKQHYLKVHAARSHMCECGLAYSTAALLAHHQRVCGLNLICICGSSFTCFETLQTHARRKGHIIHPSTMQALSSRKISLSDPAVTVQSATPPQDMWAHSIPLRHPRLDDGSKKEGNIGVTVSPSPTSASRSVPPAICPAPTTLCPTPSTFTQVTSLNLAHPIHLLAAVALGEIAVTAMKRLPCVDIGIQTDGEVMRRSRRKSSSPGRWEPGGSHGSGTRSSSKRKRTAETQTRLTHRGNKKRNAQAEHHLSSTLATGVGSTEDSFKMNTNSINEPSFVEVSADESNSDDRSLESLTLQIDLPDLISSQSSSGTQTSPRVGGLPRPQLHNISISLFDRACGDDEPAILPPSVTSITSTQTPHHISQFASTPLLIDEDEDLLGVVEEATSTMNGHPPLLAHIRSSSIETQTDHDVLLSENAGAPEDVDEIILTNTETQTDPGNLFNMNGVNSYEPSNPCQTAAGTCDVHGTDSIWCTSETQTYEDFSDIEQFMRSTIHTQTSDHSHSELFPELSFTHTQTQTSIDDPPALVTTHTQTPTHTHFPTDIY